MSQKEAQIELHKERLKEITGIPFEQFVHLTDADLDIIISKLEYQDVFELVHIVSRFVYLDQQKDSTESLLLNHLYEHMNG